MVPATSRASEGISYFVVQGVFSLCFMIILLVSQLDWWGRGLKQDPVTYSIVIDFVILSLCFIISHFVSVLSLCTDAHCFYPDSTSEHNLACVVCTAPSDGEPAPPQAQL